MIQAKRAHKTKPSYEDFKKKLVMNWYDGFIIDEIWVRFSKFWVIPGLEDMDYVQSWTQMFRKRLVLTAIWLVGAAIIAALVVGIRSAVC